MKLRTSHVIGKAYQYLCGLLFTEKSKRNIERMSEQNDQNYQSQQHFITDSPWSATDVMEIVARKTNKSLGDPKFQGLLIDESSKRKSGKDSVGVSRQYNGNLGKVDNSQTGVYSALANGDKVCLVNCRLFLPEEWIADPERCALAGIPKDKICYKTKPELALEMIEELDKQGIGYGWVGADALYGASYDFRKQLHLKGKKYVLDVHENQSIYIDRPTTYIPEGLSQRGRKPSLPKIDQELWEARQYASTLGEYEWIQIKFRSGTKGKLSGKFHFQKVWIWQKGETQPMEVVLIMRRVGKQIKYSLTNYTLEETTYEELAYKQGQRYFIESAFKEAKSELGLYDYQIRKYRAWYHHQALVMMAMHFILEKRMDLKDEQPLLSVRDVRLQMIQILKNNGVKLENEILQMKIRHKKRAEDIVIRYQKILT